MISVKTALRLCCTVAVLCAGSFASSGNTRLVDAAKKDDRAAVRSLLKTQLDVNVPGADGTTALMWASHWDDLELTDTLIHAGAKVNAANELGATALSLACDNGSSRMIQLLITAGADPNLSLLSGETPLMTCAGRGEIEAVKALLSHGANVNAKELRNSQTAVMWALAEKRPPIVRELISHGADVRARTRRGFTPLMFAAQQGDLESAELLISAGAQLNESTPQDGSALVVAAASGQEKMVMTLLDKGADQNAADADGYTALHHAASSRNMLAAVHALLAHGADPNLRIVNNPAKRDSNPNYIGATPFLLAATARNLEAMRLLAASGANPLLATTRTTFLNGTNGRRLQMVGGTTALMLAAGAGRYRGNYPQFSEAEEKLAAEEVRLALELGADVNAKNEWGQTALHAAAYLGADSLIQLLVEKGAKMDEMDNFGQTPLSIAQRIHTVALGDNFDMQPRRVYESTVNLLLRLGAAPLATSGVQVAKDVIQ